jgi:hypothetical protein
MCVVWQERERERELGSGRTFVLPAHGEEEGHVLGREVLDPIAQCISHDKAGLDLGKHTANGK